MYIQLQPVYYPRGSNYHSSPMRKSHVIIIFKSPAYSSITNTLLSLLQFFKQAEVTWNNCNGAVLLQHTIICTLCDIYLAVNIHTGRTWTRKYKYIQPSKSFLGHKLLYSQTYWYVKWNMLIYVTLKHHYAIMLIKRKILTKNTSPQFS